jgi:putative peptidoglycan lipid II flippase
VTSDGLIAGAGEESGLLDSAADAEAAAVARLREAEGAQAGGHGRALARAGLVVTSAFLLSRVLGWVRVVVIGTTFGATAELDSFFAAFRIPDLIFQLVAAGALASALIPVLAGILATGERSRAWRVASTVTNLMLVALAILGGIVFLAAPWLMPIITPGFDQAQLDKTVELTRIMLLSPLFLALGSVATSILNAQDRFAAAAIAPVMYNLAIIGAAVALAPSMGVDGLAVGVVAGSVLHLLIQLRPLANGGFRWSPSVDTGDPAAREALVLMGPRAVGLGVSQLTFLVSTSLASGLAAGSITAFNVAFTLLQIPIGVIGVPLGVVVFPSLSRDLARGAPEAFLRLLTQSLRLLIFVMLPITTIGIVVRLPLVDTLVGYGLFDATAVDLTADTLGFFLLGLAAHSLIAVEARAFYAGRDTRTPVAAAILAVIVNVGLGITLVGPMGLTGLALGIAVGAWAEALVLLAILAHRYSALDLRALGVMSVGLGGAAIIAGVVSFGALTALDRVVGSDPGLIDRLVELVVTSAVGGLVYLGLAAALRTPELRTIVATMVDLVRRPSRSAAR